MKEKIFLLLITFSVCFLNVNAQIISTIAGIGVAGTTGNGGPATSAEINNPYATALDAAGNVYIADYGANVVRKINTSGIISTFAGTGSASTSGDGGAATLAALNKPIGVAVDPSGNVYISEYIGNRVRKVIPSGTISTLVTGLSQPTGLCTDHLGNLYIANQAAHKVMKVNTSGVMTTVAGTGSSGFSGDGASALLAKLNDVSGVAVDTNGNIYIAMWNDQHLRKVNSAGIISTVAGTGTAGFSGDGGAATAAKLSQPYSCAVDLAGNVYIADVSNYRIRKITVSTGIINTVAGTGANTYNGDGILATAANLEAFHVFVSSSGNMYLCDAPNQRIRMVGPSSVITGADTLCAGSTILLTDTTGAGAGTWSSSNTNAATVNAGVVTGIAAGTTIISYTIGSFLATLTITVLPSPDVSSVSSQSICANQPTNSIAFTGSINGTTFTWVNSASIGITTTGTGNIASFPAINSTGVPVIDTVNITPHTSSCTGTPQKITITVNPLPTISAGPDVSVCPNLSTLLTATGGNSYSWSPAATLSASTGASVTATPVAATTYIVTGTNLYSCTNIDSVTVTINPLPSAGSISGVASVCAGSTILLSDTASGGTWSSSNTGFATIGSTGMVVGIAAGIDTIKYSVTNNCSTAIATQIITINPPLPSAGTISGATTVCAGLSINLSDTATGGAWSSDNTDIATVNASGVVSAITLGMVNISYAVTNSCGTVTATQLVTVNPLPVSGTISSATSVCAGNVISLNDTASGGTWSSSNVDIATVGNTGIVAGVAAGMDTITYTVNNNCGMAATTKIITVNPQPVAGVITGVDSVCASNTITLADTATGGTWNSSHINIATITASGMLTGVSAGTSTITYTVTNTCGTATTTKVITVNPQPVAGVITGADSVCASNTITLADTATGGTWSSSHINIATITASGMATGISAGTSTITYTVTNSCGTATTTKVITINPQPVADAITGTDSVCEGNTITLVDTATGGSWSSSNTNIATITASGMITGISAGTTVISYIVTNNCGTATATHTVHVAACNTGVNTVATTNLQIYPNPAYDILTVKMTSGDYNSFTITNSIGEIIIQQSINSALTNVDIRKLPAGIYYIGLKADNGSNAVRKFVKM